MHHRFDSKIRLLKNEHIKLKFSKERGIIPFLQYGHIEVSRPVKKLVDNWYKSQQFHKPLDFM